MTVREREVEEKLITVAAKYGGQCLKWVCPGWTGVPDRIILLPGGGILFVEVKRPKGGRPSPMQKWWRRRLLELGFEHWIVHNYDDLQDIERYIADFMRR